MLSKCHYIYMPFYYWTERGNEYSLNVCCKSSVCYKGMACASMLSHVWLCVTLWTVARQAPLSMGFSRQEYWNGLPFPTPGNLPDPGIEPMSPVFPALQTDALQLSHLGRPWVTKKKKKHKNFLLKNYLLNFHLKPNPTKVHTSIEDCMQLQHFSNILSGSLGERSLQICLSLLSGSHLLFCASVSLLFKVTEFLKKWLSYEDNATLEM